MHFFYIQKRKICLSKKILYQYFNAFFALPGTASPLKTFYTSLNGTKIYKPPEITDTLFINPFSTNFTKCSNTLKQFIVNLPTNCLSVFDHFVGLTLVGHR